MREVIAVVFSLAVVLGLIYVAARLSKLLMKRLDLKGTSGGIEILAFRGIAADKTLAAVRVGEKRLLLGVTSADIKVLAELSEKDEELIRSSSPEETPPASFGEILAENFRKTVKGKKDGKQ